MGPVATTATGRRMTKRAPCPGALLDDEEAVLARTLSMATERRVQAVSGEWVPINAQTVCLHGDGAHALAFAKRIRGALETAGIEVRAAHAVAA